MAEAAAPAQARQPQLRFSYDMLGEGARTEADAQRYLAVVPRRHRRASPRPRRRATARRPRDGISIKLSALFSRYEDAQRERVFAELLPRVWQLVDAAARANINLTIDAEESDRLELSLDVFEALAARIAQHHPQWRGFGLAVQAYQTRALEVVDEVARIARAHGLRFMVRLVKGAYWDGEIKRAQELGLAGYPVFTHKHHTDISYLACAQALLGHADVIYPQFATHNAGTIAAILQMARRGRRAFEMQRLHGMGEGVYREVHGGRPTCRCASTRRWASTATCWPTWCAGCWRTAPTRPSCTSWPTTRSTSTRCWPRRCMPRRRAGAAAAGGAVRRRAAATRPASTSPAWRSARRCDAAVAAAARRAGRRGDGRRRSTPRCARLHAGFRAWNDVPLAERAAALRRAADALEARLPEFCGLLVKEAHKTLGDCVAEVREAVDFCRYYADQAEQRLAAQTLPGPTGESNELRLHGRGVFVCISPWNFPLAIFAGQVVAALVAGNTRGRQAGRADARRRAALRGAAARGRRAGRRAGAAARPGRDGRRRAGGRSRAPPACASPARPRWPRSSTARWPPRTARSCR